MRPLLVALLLLAPLPAGAVKMMYTCSAQGGAVTIQDRPCGAALKQDSYATPDVGKSATPTTSAPRRAAADARPRVVDFTVACRSLAEERSGVIELLRTVAGDEREAGRLQKRLKRISQAQCTARCGPC